MTGGPGSAAGGGPATAVGSITAPTAAATGSLINNGVANSWGSSPVTLSWLCNLKALL